MELRTKEDAIKLSDAFNIVGGYFGISLKDLVDKNPLLKNFVFLEFDIEGVNELSSKQSKDGHYCGISKIPKGYRRVTTGVVKDDDLMLNEKTMIYEKCLYIDFPVSEINCVIRQENHSNEDYSE